MQGVAAGRCQSCAGWRRAKGSVKRVEGEPVGTLGNVYFHMYLLANLVGDVACLHRLLELVHVRTMSTARRAPVGVGVRYPRAGTDGRVNVESICRPRARRPR